MNKVKFKLSSLSLLLICCSSSLSVANEIDKKNNTENTDNLENSDEIVVIGERFNRRAVETCASINIITAKELEKRPDLYSLTQILKQTPNIIDTGLGNELPTIRGIDGSVSPGAMAFFTGARPRINVQIDGRTSNYNELAFGTKSLWDMKQVEVYRGPQSYAHGRNAIAGAIVMQSKDPINEYESAVKVDYGNQHRRQYAAMVSGPVVDEELLFRLSVDRQERKSYEKLADYYPAGDSSKFEATTTRAKLVWLPSALPDFYTSYTFSHIDSRAPQGEFKSNTVADTYRAVFQIRSATNIWDMGYQINDNWKFENKAIYTNYIQDRYSLPTGGPARVEGHETQIEPILKFDNGSYRGLLGLFYFNAPQDERVLLVVPNSYKDKTTTKAVYGELTFEPVQNIEVNISTRYEQEEHSRTGGSLFAVNYKDKENIFLPKFDVAYLISNDQRVGAKVARGYNPGGAGISFQPPFATYEYDAEYVWNYELYHRWISDDKRLSVNTNIFYNDYKDLQVPYYNISGNTVVDNANKAITYGAELNINWLATDELNLYAGLGLLKTKIKEYKENESYENNKLSRSPSYTLNLGGSYELPRGFEVGANVNYTGDYYSSVSNSKESKINAYSQANAYLAYNFKYGRVALYADNTFDSDKKVKVITGGYTTYQQPRVVGITAELKF
ncbi:MULTISPECIES: TonB-dependent receptor [unclassified Providencia]|uniref:TonB-dependent receptor n=1 Tax=unclassified Providencia TaxID=2633465 RepID=UPI00234900EB|nr:MULTISPECIES: TonB-dependent receptor [unclassified Providencia]